MNDELTRLKEMVTTFRDERDWKQFHKPKDMALSLTLESAELLELFQWKSEAECERLQTACQSSDSESSFKQDVQDELCDVLYWVLLMAHDFDIDLGKGFEHKMKKNAQKYPVDKASGNSQKYSEY